MDNEEDFGLELNAGSSIDTLSGTPEEIPFAGICLLCESAYEFCLCYDD